MRNVALGMRIEKENQKNLKSAIRNPKFRGPMLPAGTANPSVSKRKHIDQEAIFRFSKQRVLWGNV